MCDVSHHVATGNQVCHLQEQSVSILTAASVCQCRASRELKMEIPLQRDRAVPGSEAWNPEHRSGLARRKAPPNNGKKEVCKSRQKL